MAYIDLYGTAREEEFLQKLTVAVTDKVRDLYVAGGIQMTDPGDVLAVAAGPRNDDFRRFAEEMALTVLIVDSALTGTSTDAEFDTAVNTAWLPYAELAENKGLITVEVPAP